MGDINPQEFGELVANTANNTTLLNQISEDIKSIPAKITEARMIAEEARDDAEDAKKKIDNVDNKIGVVALRLLAIIVMVVIGLGGWILAK